MNAMIENTISDSNSSNDNQQQSINGTTAHTSDMTNNNTASCDAEQTVMKMCIAKNAAALEERLEKRKL